jgi:hypothetical protein
MAEPILIAQSKEPIWGILGGSWAGIPGDDK